MINVAHEDNTIGTTYDKEGRTLSVSRSFNPNPKSISDLVDGWTYDKVGRVSSVSRPGGGTETRGYDASGNLTSVATPRGHGIQMTYDPLNRLFSRTVPQAIGTTHLGNSITLNSLTTAAYGDTALAETQNFAYYPDGQISQATGCDATVNRTFDPNGEMRSEALTIRGVAAGCGAATHSYTTGYTYDGDGRRATMTVPAIFTTSAGATVTYSYNVGTGGGRLTGVTDAAGNAFAFSYKPSGELTLTREPGGVSRTLTWDSDGRLLSDLIPRPSSCGPDWPCFSFTGPYRSTN